MRDPLKPDGPLPSIEPVSCASGDERLAPLLSASLIVAGAILAGLLAALAFARLSPLNDPVDVVGVPLLTGYSESVEQWSFYTYVLTTLVLAGTLSRFRVVEQIPRSSLAPAGACAMLVPVVSPGLERLAIDAPRCLRRSASWPIWSAHSGLSGDGVRRVDRVARWLSLSLCGGPGFLCCP